MDVVLHTGWTDLSLFFTLCVCVCVFLCMCLCAMWRRERDRGGDRMCPSSPCNYLPIFSPSVAFIIPLRSHLGVRVCHSVAPLSFSVCRMKCRRPHIDLCLPAPTSFSPYLFPRNRRHWEISVIINQQSQQLFIQPLKERRWVLLSDTDSRWQD